MNNNNNPNVRAWEQMPMLALGHIYDHLEHKDRLNAALTCQQWRAVLFQKRFFKDFKLRLYVDNDRQCAFFRHTLCNLTTEVTIVFDFLNFFHIEKIRRLIYRLSRCDNLRGIRFETNTVGLLPPGDISKDGLVDIKQFFIEPLKVLLNRKKVPFKILDLGAIEALTFHGTELIKALGKPQDLQQLTIASLKFNPDRYRIFNLDTQLLQNFASLEVLSLDYDTLNEELLRFIQILPLKKLYICIHRLNRSHPGISEAAWATFALKFPNIELILSLVYACEAVEVLQVRILRRNMPITHLRVLFCDYINVEALDWMSCHNRTTLKSIKWIDSAYKHSDNGDMESFLRAGQDPFVMIAWRCKQLEEIVVHGYVMDPHNIVGMARLRGRHMKNLEVSMLDRAPTEANMDTFIEEISTLLGQKWEPLNLTSLHPALGYFPVSYEVRDSYVYDLIRMDLSK